MQPSFMLWLRQPVNVGTSYWRGTMKIVDASHRGLGPLEYSKICSTVFVGSALYTFLHKVTFA